MATKTVKKTVSKKSVKKAPVKRKTTHKKSAAAMKSFRIARDVPPFFAFRVSLQTFYWTLLIIVIIFLQLWILKTQLDAANATDAVTNQLHYNVVHPSK